MKIIMRRPQGGAAQQSTDRGNPCRCHFSVYARANGVRMILLPVLDKKLSKLFIALKVRQELHETAFVALCHKRATRITVPSS